MSLSELGKHIRLLVEAKHLLVTETAYSSDQKVVKLFFNHDAAFLKLFSLDFYQEALFSSEIKELFFHKDFQQKNSCLVLQQIVGSSAESWCQLAEPVRSVASSDQFF